MTYCTVQSHRGLQLWFSPTMSGNAARPEGPAEPVIGSQKHTNSNRITTTRLVVQANARDA